MNKWILAATLVVASAAHADIPTSQRDALIALYNATGGPNWREAAGWNGAPGSECDWYSVQCNDDRTTVINVALIDNNLVGTLPSEIGNLKDLRDLYIYDNRLSGSVPDSIGQLSNLENLILDRNGLTGVLPASLGNLTKLRVFNIDGNGIVGPIPATIGNMTAVEEIDLSYNPLTGAQIPTSIGQLSNLTSLAITNSQISGQIPRELGNLLKLQHLTLTEDNLTGTIPPELGRLTELRDLRFDANRLEGTIPVEFRSLRNLEQLDLGRNLLTGQIPSELGNLTNLKILTLASNQLSGSIPESLYGLTALQEFRLGDNRFTGTISRSIGNLQNVIVYSVGQNLLTGQIPTEVGSLPKLEVLEFLNNDLDGPIPSQLGNLPVLRYIDFGGNNLSGQIPREIGSLTKLQTFSVYENQLSGNIPPELGNLTELEVLYLTSNRLTGTIPDSFRNLKKLRSWYLAGNQLTGTIPEWIGELSELTDIFWAVNRFTGSIPRSIGDLSHMYYFDIGDNRLTGSIPREVGKMSEMAFLFLNSNELTGPIPVEIGDAKELLNVRLEFNNLSGPLPSSIGGLTKLQFLLLAVNQFEGPIPASFGNLSNLELLSLGGNRLTGTIPSELGRLPRLTEIGLDKNALRGPIPSSVTNLPLRQQGSDFGFNALFTNDAAVRAFINNKQGDQDFEASQTVPPTNVRVTSTTDRSALVEWDLIRYVFDDGGYQVVASKTQGGPPVSIATTADKSINGITVRNLEPLTTYFFTVTTVTHPHDFQENLIVSDPSPIVSAATTQKVVAPADVVVTEAPTGLIQVDGVPRNDDSFTLTNFGDAATDISFFTDGDFFTLDPATFTLAGGASQIVRVRSTPKPFGTYYGFIAAQGEGVGDDVFVYVSLLSIAKPTGTPIAEPVLSRIEVAGAIGSDSVGTARFRNRGDAPLSGIVLSDQPFVVPGRDPITIDPGQTGTVNFTVVRSRRPPDAEGALTASLTLVYVDGSSVQQLRAGEDGLLPILNQATPPAGFSVSLVTVVDQPRPPVAPGTVPGITGGDIGLFAAGIASFTRTFGNFVSDISIQNAASARSINDVRLFFTPTNSAQASVASLNPIGSAQSVSLANIVTTVYGSDTATGSLQIRSSGTQNLSALAKLVNIRDRGIFTGDVPLFRSDRSVAATQQVILPGVRKSSSIHTDLYLQETAGAPLSARIEFLDASGSSVGAPRDVSVTPFNMAEVLDAVPANAATVIVTNVAGSAGRLAAYGRVVDETSGDTWSVADWSRVNRFALTDPIRIPFVDGAGTTTSPTTRPRRRAVVHEFGPRPSTELTLFNPATTETRLRMQIFESAGRFTERELAVGPRQTMIVNDAGGTSPSSISYIVLTPLRNGQIAVTARSAKSVIGTQGTSVPVISAVTGLRVGQIQRFPGLNDSTSATVISAKPGTFRTAFGLVEIAGAPATIRARILLDTGRSLVTQIIGRDFTLAPGQQMFSDNMVRAIVGDSRETGLGDLHNLQIQFEVVEGSGAVVPFVIETDNGSGDQLMRLE